MDCIHKITHKVNQELYLFYVSIIYARTHTHTRAHDWEEINELMYNATIECVLLFYINGLLYVLRTDISKVPRKQYENCCCYLVVVSAVVASYAIFPTTSLPISHPQGGGLPSLSLSPSRSLFLSLVCSSHFDFLTFHYWNELRPNYTIQTHASKFVYLCE